MQAPEVNRQQNHISQVPPSHTLLPIALDCLNDKDSKHPSAHQLCERVADLKGMPNYVDSAITNQNRDTHDLEEIRSLTVRLEEKDRTILSKEEEIQQLRQQLQERDQASRQIEERERQLGQVNQQLRQEKDQANRQLEERERELGQVNQQLNRQLQLEKDQNARQKEERGRQLGRVNQQLEASNQAVAQFKRQIAELEQQLCQREQQKTKASRKGKEPTNFKLIWREGKSTPCKMTRWCDAVVDGNIVYVRDATVKLIYSYDVRSDSWSHQVTRLCSGRWLNNSHQWLANFCWGSCLWYMFQ